MAKTIDFYLSITSPWTFLGWKRFEEIAAGHGAEIVYKPANFAEIFPVSGGLPLPKRAPQRRAYRMAELKRWREHLGIPINLEPKFFPAHGWPAAGMVTAAREQGFDCGALGHAIQRALWVEDRNIDDRDTLAAIAGESGLDGPALLDAAESEAVKAAFAADTQEAIDRGVFGAPSYVYKDEIFWGQDRLDFVERALARD